MNRWSLGTLIWLPVSVALTIALLVLAWWLIRRLRPRADVFDRGPTLVLGIACAVGALALVVCTAIGMWPYDSEYHQWRETSGTVQTIDSRLVAEGHGSTQRFVVTFTDGRQRACDDTRCAQVKVHDSLTLDCKRAWQWAGTPGYDCNFVEDRR